MPDFYNEEQVQQILQKAIARKGARQDLTREQVREIASDLGISDADFAIAEQEWLAQSVQDRERVVFDTYRKKKFRDHAIKYALVNAFLIGINLLTSGNISWAIYPLLGWGLAVALDAWATYQTDSAEYEKQFQQWSRQQKRSLIATQITDKVTAKLEEWLKPQ
ncbi:2TM domain-containing protein [Pseudanabaena sp. PCC 6802]|uniref:2TM domain-containing protein n=1 Tax=Pseudanabaena sp. PCC 6802 TaxID=118173 RepID=UPI000346951A|nr:2TM domain-containing protein [Pseudanabaena sp. PCC 6802]